MRMESIDGLVDSDEESTIATRKQAKAALHAQKSPSSKVLSTNKDAEPARTRSSDGLSDSDDELTETIKASQSPSPSKQIHRRKDQSRKKPTEASAEHNSSDGLVDSEDESVPPASATLSLSSKSALRKKRPQSSKSPSRNNAQSNIEIKRSCVAHEFKEGMKVDYLDEGDKTRDETWIELVVESVRFDGSLILSDANEEYSIEIPSSDVRKFVRLNIPRCVEIDHLCLNCGQSCTSHLCVNEEPSYWYWKCHSCSYWRRDNDVRGARQSKGGPSCLCGQPSTLNQALGSQKMWLCSKTSGTKCAFSLLFGASASPAVGPTEEVETGSTNHENFLVDGETLRALQNLFHVDASDGQELGVGRDVQGSIPEGYYDHLRVRRAWRVVHRDRFARFSQYRDEVAARREAQGLSEDSTPLRPAYQAAVEGLVETANRVHQGGFTPPSKAANEVLLLHGTKPEVVKSILESSLDPKMAGRGMFGRGTYAAEHAAKIDQYCVSTTERTRDERTQDLFSELFDRADDAPEDGVYFALVCRYVLGTPAVTRDGDTELSGADLFVNAEKSKLQPGFDSLVAEAGDDCLVKRFREFVVFDPGAIHIEYLVSFT